MAHKYTIEMIAYRPTFQTVEIEAEDELSAIEAAFAHVQANPEDWDDSLVVVEIEVDSIESDNPDDFEDEEADEEEDSKPE
jgi:hypothetical protein